MMTLHTMRDPVVPVFHEDLLAQVASGPNLVRRSVDRFDEATAPSAAIARAMSRSRASR